MQNMMRQAQKLQKQMEKSQAELAATQFTGSSVQDLVTATFTGDKKLVSIDFKADVVDADDIETLQEMTVQAVNAALTKVDEATQKKLGAFAGKLPFKRKRDWIFSSRDFFIQNYKSKTEIAGKRGLDNVDSLSFPPSDFGGRSCCQ